MYWHCTSVRSLTALAGLAVLAAGCGDIKVPPSTVADAKGDTGGSDADVVTATPGDPVVCETYCSDITQVCTGANSQYPNKSVCLSSCNTWLGLPPGEDGDTSGNTAQCRIYHTSVAAAGGADEHCPHAGPTGGNECGTWCDNYCHLALRNCTGSLKLYSSDSECRAACANFPTDGALDAEDGDSVQCRINNLALALAEPGLDATYCPRGSSGGGDTCAELADCATYCADITQACTAGNQQYADENTCNQYCTLYGKLPLGTKGSQQSENTVACRTYHASLAAKSDPGTHCKHAGPTGDRTCGSLCENYCHLAMTNCSGQYALYPDLDACMDACNGFPTGGANLAQEGDSVQCRIFYAGRAGIEGDSSAQTQCQLAAIWSEACSEELPIGCTGGKAATTEGCQLCDDAETGARQAVTQLAALYQACEVDGDCTLANAKTACFDGCDEAINVGFTLAFSQGIERISQAWCTDFGASSAICTPGALTCIDQVARCVSGVCTSEVGP
ncbi:MAG: hypothetical protein H6744_01720 [Deltaproteobacteria bacterium]|nr:hypothetical protein [Deltaproteobacteria bacterium]MCB9785386.1 hypothetical protein [Deltaproteobacteria bacterium]